MRILWGRRPSGLVYVVALALAGPGLLAGCGKPAALSARFPQRASVKLPGLAFSILTDTGPAPSIQVKLDNAIEVLTKRCMQARRLKYYVTLESFPSPAGLFEFPAYGSLAEREVTGYGDYTAARRQADDSRGRNSAHLSEVREDVYIRSLSSRARARYYQNFWGSPSDVESVTLPGGARAQIQRGGCRGMAARVLYGSVTHYLLATTGASAVTSELIRAVRSAPRFVSAMHSWSKCMASHGFRYPDPFTAKDYFAAQYWKHGPSLTLRNQEIAVAVADWKCAKKAALVPVTTAAQDEQAGRLGKSLEGVLLRITTIEIHAAKKADQLVPRS